MLDMESMPRVPDWAVRDQLSELQQQIDQLHFSYLEIDDSPQKLEQRQKLEGYIREFLCLVPHSRKFVLRETLQVLHKSAASHENFSGYRAALAWNAIARYAANLLTQPWRKEYKEIKLYCGFYKHEIEQNLIGAETMFEAMGYRPVDHSTLALEGPICPDQVANVSRDALVAVVECQLLKSVWENVSAVCSVKWLEALQFREMHIGGPEQACRALLYRHNERNYQQQKHENILPTYVTGDADAHLRHFHGMCNSNNPATIQQTDNVSNAHLPFNADMMQGQQCLYGGQYLTQQQTPYHHQMSCYGYHQPTYSAIPLPIGIPIPYPVQGYVMPANYMGQVKPVGYSHGDVSVALQPLSKVNGYAGQHTVATGQLIEVDSGQHQMDVPSSHQHQQHIYEDEVDSRISKLESISHKTNDRRMERINNNKQEKTKGSIQSEDSFETWDYVYRDLEKQGYNKDLGDRENILEKNLRKTSQTQLEHAFNSMSLQKANNQVESNNKNENNYTEKLSNDKVKNNKLKSGTLKREISQKMQPTQNQEIPRNKQPAKKIDQWQCAACTFNNPTKKDICEMCGKSRKIGSEITPLTSGGKECSKCTLVNGRDTKICEACGASLQDSPTYI